MSFEVCPFNLDKIAGGGGYEWNNDWGELTIFQQVIPRIQPNTKVLDIFAGCGRASIPLAMYGALVTAVEADAQRVVGLEKMFSDTGLAGALVQVLSEDATTQIAELVHRFDVILAIDALTHLPKTKGMDLIGMLSDYLYGSGTIAINAPAAESEVYGWLREQAERVDYDTYLQECGCSGELKLEPFAFYYPGELEFMLSQSGGKILNSTLTNAPSMGNYNRVVVAEFS